MIDLCVVNHNTKDHLSRLVTTLRNSLNILQPWLLFVADNGSTDGSVEWLKELWDEDKDYLQVLGCNDNIGYSAACNILATHGKSDIIGFLNADVWLRTQDIHDIQSAFDRDPEVSILGVKQRNERYRIVHAGIEGTNEQPKHRGWLSYDPLDKWYRDKLEMVTVSGSAYFIRRKVWEDLTNCEIYRKISEGASGAFLPTPHYFEETWCSYHARAHGHKVFYDGKISIGHTWHASSQVGGPAETDYFPISQDLFRKACDMHGIKHN